MGHPLRKLKSLYEILVLNLRRILLCYVVKFFFKMHCNMVKKISPGDFCLKSYVLVFLFIFSINYVYECNMICLYYIFSFLWTLNDYLSKQRSNCGNSHLTSAVLSHYSLKDLYAQPYCRVVFQAQVSLSSYVSYVSGARSEIYIETTALFLYASIFKLRLVKTF